jgi:hypothetical protein
MEHMKVKFECAKCGTLLREHIHSPGVDRGEYMRSAIGECPICHPPQPTYGDLDVETVAKWHREVWVGNERLAEWETISELAREDHRRVARAVITTIQELLVIAIGDDVHGHIAHLLHTYCTLRGE